MARDVPARILLGVRKNGAGAGYVFFRSDGIDLVFRFVAFVGNCQDADAVDGRVGCTKTGNSQARMVPGEVDGVGDEKQECERCGTAQNQAGAGRRTIGRVRHGFELRDILHREEFGWKRELGRLTQAAGLPDAGICGCKEWGTGPIVGEVCKQRSWRLAAIRDDVAR